MCEDVEVQNQCRKIMLSTKEIYKMLFHYKPIISHEGTYYFIYCRKFIQIYYIKKFFIYKPKFSKKYNKCKTI